MRQKTISAVCKGVGAVLVALGMMFATTTTGLAGFAAADRWSSLDDVLKIIGKRIGIAKQSGQVPRATVDDILARSREGLQPTTREPGEMFGDILDWSCLAHDVYEVSGRDAATDYIQTRTPWFQRNAITAQTNELVKLQQDDDGMGFDVVEIICAG
jgi:hypothetical protein